ncbi:MAG: hypothetical protein GXP47_04155 [Acidobacteria bacterium]|nr:hypothetical protein [Acidobacteriota bacterium]
MSSALCQLTVPDTGDGWVPVIVDPDTSPLPCRRGDFQLLHQERVVVETPDGTFIGQVSLFCTPVLKAPEVRSGRILRRPTEEDLSRERNAGEVAVEIERYLKSRVTELGLDMRPLKVRIPLVGSRAVIFFSSEQRVDFRRLVRELARRFRRRIDMRPLGVRDGAKLVGALGPCGRGLCCVTFMNRFHSVTVRMAKRQNLSLNPTKISGMCGRLMCCLAHEVDQYPKPQRR